MRFIYAIAYIVIALIAADCVVEAQPANSVSNTNNVSTTIATGGTFQQIAAANSTRKSLDFVNICNVAGNCTAVTNKCYLFIAATGTPTVANSIPVPAGSEYLRSSGNIPSDAILATCDGNGDKFYLGLQ